MKTKSLTRKLTITAVIAALYVVLTLISAAAGLASGVIQVRLSEALTVLVYFTPYAVPGVTIGCFLSNLLLGLPVPDLIFGTMATLVGAAVAYLLRKHRYLVPIPTILSNMIIIPLVLRYAYGVPDAIWFLMVTVGAGELISAGILGLLLLSVLKKHASVFAR